MNYNNLYEKELSLQADRRKAGVEFIKIISDLWYDKSIELIFFRNQLIDTTVSRSQPSIYDTFSSIFEISRIHSHTKK